MQRNLETSSILPADLVGEERPRAALEAKRSSANVR